jgi:hypothetical protein
MSSMKNLRLRRAYLGRCRHYAERAKCIVQQPFVDVLVQTSDEEVGANVQLLFIRGCLIWKPNCVSTRLGDADRYGKREWANGDAWARARKDTMLRSLRRTLLTRMGFPHNFIWFMILQAYSASSSVWNSQNP